MEITIRTAVTDDVDSIRFLFRDTVTFINSKDYTAEEVKVWADHYKNVENFKSKITRQYFIVAVADEGIVGFSSIEDSGYLNFMYVHKDFQGKQIATKLLKEIEARAAYLSVEKIFSHVSKTARPFFEKKGFIKTGENINRVGEVKFVNSIMVKNNYSSTIKSNIGFG